MRASEQMAFRTDEKRCSLPAAKAVLAIHNVRLKTQFPKSSEQLHLHHARIRRWRQNMELTVGLQGISRPEMEDRLRLRRRATSEKQTCEDNQTCRCPPSNGIENHGQVDFAMYRASIRFSYA